MNDHYTKLARNLYNYCFEKDSENFSPPLVSNKFIVQEHQLKSVCLRLLQLDSNESIFIELLSSNYYELDLWLIEGIGYLNENVTSDEVPDAYLLEAFINNKADSEIVEVLPMMFLLQSLYHLYRFRKSYQFPEGANDAMLNAQTSYSMALSKLMEHALRKGQEIHLSQIRTVRKNKSTWLKDHIDMFEEIDQIVLKIGANKKRIPVQSAVIEWATNNGINDLKCIERISNQYKRYKRLYLST